MIRRAEFSTSIKLAIIARARDSSSVLHCEACGKRVEKGGYHIDHVISEGIAARKRKLKPSDGQLLCLDCHRKKTGRDAELLAKARRLGERFGGLIGPSRIARQFKIVQEEPPGD